MAITSRRKTAHTGAGSEPAGAEKRKGNGQKRADSGSCNGNTDSLKQQVKEAVFFSGKEKSPVGLQAGRLTMLFKVPGLVWEKSGGVWSCETDDKISGVFLCQAAVRCCFRLGPDVASVRNSLRISADR